MDKPALQPVPEGLSKRELLAGMAMQGLLSSGAAHGPQMQSDANQVALHAIGYADALCAVLDADK